jgi:predicted GNAT superfamily acetyltransferase
MNLDAIEIRPLRTNDDCHAAAALQHDVWGRDYDDVVPATLLHVLDYVGGLAAGAFDPSGRLLGFVFGINGVRDGQLVHWSHMLGVREEMRNLGLGRKLKTYQRETLATLGVKRIFWTFDPLMAKNAHFNLNRLGAEVVQFVPDMYGTTASPLHLGLATDRLIVSIGTDSVAEPRRNTQSPPGAPVLTAFPRLNDVTVSVGDRSPDAALIEIPSDILAVLTRSSASARIWRLAVRDHFQWALTHGYDIVGVQREASSDRYFYVVARRASLAARGEHHHTPVIRSAATL